MEDYMTEQRKIRFDEHLSGEGALTLAFATFTALLLGLLFVPLSFAQQQDQRTFHSAEEASLAFFSAAQQENERALLDILGPAGKEVISSGESTEDLDHRVGFVLQKKRSGERRVGEGWRSRRSPDPLKKKNKESCI